MDYAYTISPSTEPGRLAAHFTDRDVLIILASNMINRVGSRRDALNVATHLVFAAELESDVRTWIDGKAKWLIGAPAREAAAEAARIAHKAEMAAYFAEKEEKARKKQAKRLAAGESVKVRFEQFVVYFPYAKGAPALMRAAGAKWNPDYRGWAFGNDARAAVEAAMPECKALVVEQVARDARKAKARAKARSESGGLGMGARWDMSDDEIMSELGYMPRTERDMEQAFGTSDY